HPLLGNSSYLLPWVFDYGYSYADRPVKKKKQKTLKQLKDQCWKVFSEWIRRSHADEGGTVECFTCGSLMHWKESHAGHFVGGRSNAVLFDERIVKPQCPRC